MNSTLCVRVAVFALLASPLLALAQGRTDYYNTESVQVDPIAVVEVGGRQYLAAVNTPDNSVEFYETGESRPVDQRFLVRVRTGLEPVSLAWVPELSRLYVACALSDAVTVIHLTPGGHGLGLVATVERTEWVADEPVALAHLPFTEDDGEGGAVTRHSLVLAHRDQDGFGWIDAFTLAPIVPGVRIFDPTVAKGDIDQDTFPDLIALKAPRDVEVRCGRLFLLSEKGGGRPEFDFDVFSVDLSGTAARDLPLPNTGNFNFAFAANDDLFVVGGHALNDVLRDEAAVAAAPTGFVVSTVTMVRGACGSTPAFKVRDVNLEMAGTPLVPVPVNKKRAMTQLTSLALFERHGLVPKVFFTAFGNDLIGVVEPDWAQNPDLWPLRRMRVPLAPGSTQELAGPRGLALKPANPGDPADPGARLYVLNRLDNSVAIYDPVTEGLLGVFALRHDPTPPYLRAGRRFLYDARLGNGFNACSSCHVDGRTDGLAWDLGDGQTPPVDPLSLFGPMPALTNFPADKNFMVTQSLQGLLNWEVEPAIQDLVTNAPYHWRADRADFTRFEPAFQGLLGGAGLRTDEMDAFEEFVNSIHYPPNPQQFLTRVYTGIPIEADLDPLPTGAQAGLAMFHIFPSVGSAACAHCHALPEGSDNKIPLILAGHNPFAPLDPQGAQPVEAAALRGLFQKSARLERSGSVLPENAPVTGLEGLFHTGFIEKSQPPVLPPATDFNRVASQNSFVRHFFSVVLGCGVNDFCANVIAMSQLLHEFDTGTAPTVGLPYTVDPGNNANSGLTQIAFDVLEEQARLANSGLSIQAWIGGAERGFVFDPRFGHYVEVPGGAAFSRLQLLALVTAGADRLVALGTPLGSERRVASPTGQVPATPPGAPPAGVKLLPMRPNTAYANVPLLTANWFDPATPSHGGFFAHTIRLFQQGVISTAPPGAGAFGVELRWEPSRRFRVAVEGGGINPRLTLHVHDDPAQPATPPDLTKTPEDSGQVATRAISLPLHPTDDVDAVTGAPVYETSVELDPREFLRLMLGGAYNPAVVAALGDSALTFQEVLPLDPVLAFDADAFNWLYVRVVAESGVVGDGGWQRLRLESAAGPASPPTRSIDFLRRSSGGAPHRGLRPAKGAPCALRDPGRPRRR